MVFPALVFKTFSYHLACFVPNYRCGHHWVIGSWFLRNGIHLLFITLSPFIFIHFSCFPFFLFLFSLSFFSLLLFQFVLTFLFIIYIDLSHTCVTFPTFTNVVPLPTEVPWGPLLAPRHALACLPLHFSPFCNPQGFLLTIVPIKVVLSAFGGSTKHILTTINLDDCP